MRVSVRLVVNRPCSLDSFTRDSLSCVFGDFFLIFLEGLPVSLPFKYVVRIKGISIGPPSPQLCFHTLAVKRDQILFICQHVCVYVCVCVCVSV